VAIITGRCAAQPPRHTSNALIQTADSLLGTGSLRRSVELTIYTVPPVGCGASAEVLRTA